MATFNKFDCFTENLAEGVHNLQSNQLVVALTNTLPVVTNSLLSNITEIAYTTFVNGTTTGRNLALAAVSPSTQTAGVYKLILQDLVLTANATTPSFRYAVIYNSQGNGITNPLIGWYDYTSSIQLNNLETLTLDFDQVAGVLTLT
jgi:hypothetical protein